MPRIQLINEAGHDRAAYRNLLKYVARPDKCICGFMGMTNVCDIPQIISGIVPGTMSYKMVDRQRKFLMRYHENHDGRYAMHVIIQFAPSEAAYLDHQKVLDIAYFVAMTEFPDYICYFAVHDHSCYKGTQDTSYHIDMMIVLINIYDGTFLGLGPKGWYKVGCDIAGYLKNFMPEEAVEKVIIKNGRTEKEMM